MLAGHSPHDYLLNILIIILVPIAVLNIIHIIVPIIVAIIMPIVVTIIIASIVQIIATIVPRAKFFNVPITTLIKESMVTIGTTLERIIPTISLPKTVSSNVPIITATMVSVLPSVLVSPIESATLFMIIPKLMRVHIILARLSLVLFTATGRRKQSRVLGRPVDRSSSRIESVRRVEASRGLLVILGLFSSVVRAEMVVLAELRSHLVGTALAVILLREAVILLESPQDCSALTAMLLLVDVETVIAQEVEFVAEIILQVCLLGCIQGLFAAFLRRSHVGAFGE